MTGYVRWRDIREEFIAEAGGAEVFESGRQELLAQVVGARLAEVRRARGFTQQQIAERMGVTKGRVSQIERGGCTKPSTSTTATSPPSPNCADHLFRRLALIPCRGIDRVTQTLDRIRHSFGGGGRRTRC
jgi:DNA-binding XRE family transcriptional regulator